MRSSSSVVAALFALSIAAPAGCSTSSPTDDAEPYPQPPANGVQGFVARGPYPHDFNPFAHSIGVCYGHFMGRDKFMTASVPSDLDVLTKTDGFKMLHLYNLFASEKLDLDPAMKAALDYSAAQSPKIEILLGTLNGMVTGLLQTAAGADQYVAALKPYLDTGIIKTLALANEPNAKGDANIAPNVWAAAARNLRAALTAAGFPDLPISATLLFGGVRSYPAPGSGQTVETAAVFEEDGGTYSMLGYIQAINDVNARPFVFVNLLPAITVNQVVRDAPVTAPWYPSFGLFESTAAPPDGALAPYMALTDLQYNVIRYALAKAGLQRVQVYVSESGWPSDADGLSANDNGSSGPFATPANETTYVNNLLNRWAQPSGVPVFVFEAFDEPDQGPGKKTWGLYDKFGKLKPGIVFPSFISQ